MGRRPNAKVVIACSGVRAEANSFVSESAIQSMNRSELLVLQRRCGMGDEWGMITMPTEWFAPGITRSHAHRRVAVPNRVKNASLSDETYEDLCVSITRLAIIEFLVPTGDRRGKRLLSPTTIITSLRAFLNLALVALSFKGRIAGQIFSHVSERKLTALLSRNGSKELRRLLFLKSINLWSDTPQVESTGPVEPDRSGQALSVNRVTLSTPFLPFPDEFTAAAGWRMAWVTETLGPELMKCATALAALIALVPNTSPSKHAFESKLSYSAIRFLSDYQWIPIQIPFDFSEKAKRRFRWPPQNLQGLRLFLTLLQTSHLFIFLLSTGGRISEALSLTEESLSADATGMTVNGRSYKLVFKPEGQERDWPVPALALYAIRQQIQLAEIAPSINLRGVNGDAISADTIWRRIGSGHAITGDYNEMLFDVIQNLGLSNLLNGRPHAHRFRKTIARLIALALVDAPKILMDLFGHQTIEMTLHYILTDPNIRAETLEVARAQVIMLAESTIEQSESTGGRASAAVKKAIADERARLGRDLGSDDIKALAEILTLSGTSWQLVRPSIICTKLPQQFGPCSRGVAAPEPSRCRSECDYRLEAAALHDDISRVIEEAVRLYEQSVNDDDPIMVEYWAGQLLSNLSRFDDLRIKWEFHPTVRMITGGTEASRP